MAEVIADTRHVEALPAGGWQTAGASRTGSQRRANEDAWTIIPAEGQASAGAPRPLLLAVADGVGGEAAGEEASAAATHALATAWRAWRPRRPAGVEETAGALLVAAQAADAAVRQLAERRPAARGAATTLTAVAAGVDFLAIVHAGDSRAYLLQGGETILLTADHTWVAEHPAAPPETTGAMRHVITRFLGLPGGCPLDVTTRARHPQTGLLLCSDGVTNVVGPDELAQTVAAPGAGGARSRADLLLALVAQRDGADDATAVVAWPGGLTVGDPHASPLADPVADPFGLRRLLERQRPPAGRRAVRRLKRGALLGLAGTAAAGAVAWWALPWLQESVREIVRQPFRLPAEPAAESYLQGWAAGDVAALYERLAPETQQTLDRDAFARQHQAFGAELTLQGLTLTPQAGGTAGTAGTAGAAGGNGDRVEVPFAAVYATARYGELRRDNRLPLLWRAGTWRVAWSPAVLLPDLAGGRTLRAFPDDAARGGLLDRQARPLATTPTGPGRRAYPQGTVAGALTGYVDGDMVGRAGLEGAADALLAGQRGGRLTVLAPSGEIASTLSAVPPRAGETVRLTLDLDLQKECEAALGGRRGSVVVLDPRDGAVLALASAPGYDPNAFVTSGDVGAILNDPGQPLVNRPLQGLYPPGSIFKAVTMAAGLERGTFRPDSQFTCNGRWTELPGLTFDCWLRSGHGRLDLVSGLTRSCNCVFYEVARQLDEQDSGYLPEFAVRSGFGAATGAVPGQEPGGTVPSPLWKRQTLNDGWARGDAVNMAIGQGNLLVTPLQIAALYGAIAAGGQRRGPRLLDRAALPGGTVERLLTPPAKPPLPWGGATLEAVRQGLRGVVGPGGTAADAFQGSALAPITAGKTGTAESGPGRAPHAWFACFAPLDDPQVVVLAMLEQAGEGSQVAAPLARGVLDVALRYGARP